MPQGVTFTADGQGSVLGEAFHGEFRLHGIKTAHGMGIGQGEGDHTALAVIAAHNGRQSHHCPVILHTVFEMHQGGVGGVDGKGFVFSHHFYRQCNIFSI